MYAFLKLHIIRKVSPEQVVLTAIDDNFLGICKRNMK